MFHVMVLLARQYESSEILYMMYYRLPTTGAHYMSCVLETLHVYITTPIIIHVHVCTGTTGKPGTR